MKGEAAKRAFIQLRAEGKSYSAIAAELNISKSTCTAWERELGAEITEAQQITRDELTTAYRMTAEARVAELKGTLDSINAALAQKDLAQLPADKLLALKLKYTNALASASICQENEAMFRSPGASL